MAIKLKRSRSRSRRMFHKKTAWPRVLGWILTLAVCAAAGFGVAYWAENSSADNKPTTPSSNASTTVSSSTTATTTPTKPPEPVTEKVAHVTLTALRDGATRQTTLAELKEDDYTAVLFDLKDENGVLHYAFSGELAKKARAAAADALTAEELTAIMQDCRAASLEPIARIYTFKDKTATAKLKSGRINWSGDKVTLWLDAAASKGGKSWLNPYAEEAHAYITELAAELKQLGFKTLMLDGVQFPEKTFEAYFGTKEQTAEGYLKALTRFVTGLKTQLADTRLLVSVNWDAVTGTNTAVYGGNPLSFGADGVCIKPTENMTAAQLQTDWNQILTRLEFFEGKKPEVIPWLTTAQSALADALPAKTPLVQGDL